ncbi:hypothetical protein [Roseateles koreensis]|uniref:Uncharacterized protein n=1 Tax=Roseateles koreensis TaxID=2987526 RepID=A0ABT5KWU1_9BURK|nr:hypothetical protein [Roseateles koreensis]MDC8787287.1 hypothetical protein [Roseateles koreensis]
MDTDGTNKSHEFLKKAIVAGTELDEQPLNWLQIAKAIRGPGTEKIKVWADFPTRRPQEALAGVQAKIGVRKTGEKYTNQLCEREIRERFVFCLDVSVELGMYCQKKFEQNSTMTIKQLIPMIREALPGKSTKENWNLTSRTCKIRFSQRVAERGRLCLRR